MHLKLYYYPLANFGDEPLNTWLWPRLLPSQLSLDAATLLVGIGTLLNAHLPRAPHKAIFSSGAGYSAADTDERWHIYCLRGPRSARRLGLPPETAISDGAVLVRTLGLVAPPKTYRVAYMPHWRSDYHGHWQAICRQAGLHFIDPTGKVDDILDAIQRSELLLTEALHGAVVADALRVPWVAIKAYRHILSFKWHDWCESLGLAYQPVTLPAVYQAASVTTQLPARLGSWVIAVVQRLAAGFHRQTSRQAVAALDQLARTARPTLSSDRVIAQVTERMLARLDCLKQDLAVGHLGSAVNIAQQVSS